MKDIGSYIGFEFDTGRELFRDIPENRIKRLNSCRAALCHAVRLYGVQKVYVAKYQCDEVFSFLEAQKIEVLPYDLDDDFCPVLEANPLDTAIILSNYFGLFGERHFAPLLQKFHNVILDHAQALYAPPMEGCYNCYSPRKFVASPDGGYVIGPDANRFSYEEDCSSDTCRFLWSRYEYGLAMHGYEFKKQNDSRLHEPVIRTMSKLTRAMLDAADYEGAKAKRRQNFAYARSLFDGMNRLNIERLLDEDAVPYGYPLLTDTDLIPAFHEARIYQPHFWEYLIGTAPRDSREYRLAKYLTLVCIDQTVGEDDIKRQFEVAESLL